MTHFSLMPQGCAWTTSCAGISIICWESLFVWSWAIHSTKGGTLWHFWGWKQSHQTKSGGKIQIADARRGNSREREGGRGGAQIKSKKAQSVRKNLCTFSLCNASMFFAGGCGWWKAIVPDEATQEIVPHWKSLTGILAHHRNCHREASSDQWIQLYSGGSLSQPNCSSSSIFIPFWGLWLWSTSRGLCPHPVGFVDGKFHRSQPPPRSYMFFAFLPV